MAWPRLLPSGNYQGCYRDKNNDIQSAGTFTQRAEALREAAAMEREQRQPGAIDPGAGRIQWGAWFDLWFDRPMAYATESTYRSTADCHLFPRWEYVRLDAIEELDAIAWVKQMQKPKKKGVQPKSPYVIRNALMLLKTTLNAAVRAKRLGVNPVSGVPYPDLPEGLERYLTPAEVEAITFYMDGPNALIVETDVNTGLRFGELAGLHLPRLDLERKVIHVVEAFDQKAGVINILPKDRQSRTVPIPDDLVAKLAHWVHVAAPSRQETCGIPHASGRCIGDLVFRGARGAPLKSNEWGRGPWSRAVGLAGIEGRVRPHDMRHTYASWLLQQRLSIPELALMLGHSDWEVTKRYAHLCEDASHDAVREALVEHRRAAPRAADRLDGTQYDAMPTNGLHAV